MQEKPTHKVDFAILSPLPEESECLIAKFQNYKQSNITLDQFDFNIIHYKNHRILQTYSGIGTTFAASTFTLINEYFHPDYVFLLGTAGGLTNDINVNDAVIVDEAFESEIQGLFDIVCNTAFENCFINPLKKKKVPSTYSADSELLKLASTIKKENSKIHLGKAATTNTFPAPKALFQNIKKQHAKCIDMETSALYQIAWILNLRALAIRGISNVLDVNGEDNNLTAINIIKSMENATNLLLSLIDSLIDIKS